MDFSTLFSEKLADINAEENRIAVVDDSNLAARGILGDNSREDAANNANDLVLTAPPEPGERKRRGRKPGVGNKPKVIEAEVMPPTPAQSALAGSIVEAQALAVYGLAAMFSEPESAAKMYDLHVNKHREKLTLGYAKLCQEYGVEVSGKMAAASALVLTQVQVMRDCWQEWIPKAEEEPGKQVVIKR